MEITPWSGKSILDQLGTSLLNICTSWGQTSFRKVALVCAAQAGLARSSLYPGAHTSAPPLEGGSPGSQNSPCGLLEGRWPPPALNLLVLASDVTALFHGPLVHLHSLHPQIILCGQVSGSDRNLCYTYQVSWLQFFQHPPPQLQEVCLSC